MTLNSYNNEVYSDSTKNENRNLRSHETHVRIDRKSAGMSHRYPKQLQNMRTLHAGNSITNSLLQEESQNTSRGHIRHILPLYSR
jgi:hypothetical protein